MSQPIDRYEPSTFEAEIYKRWEDADAFKPRGDGEPYVIMLPPPNITGSLHMGHALQDTLMDVLIRYHRMKGEKVMWLPGMDHAALPTNKILIDQLQSEGTTREAIGRDAFAERARSWYAQTGATILQQMKRLGASCDWSRQRFTMDDDYYRAVQETFIRYFERGYIYRGARIVNWDPTTQTTVSDLEIDYKTERAPYYYFQYGPFEISTARPETKFADKYVVMHPSDDRYTQYKHGETFVAEWINGPIIATVIKDEAADPNVGSGVMTITPWHSVVDFEIAQRHKLDLEQVIDFEGKLLPIAEEFAGQTISEARPKIVEKLEQKKLLIKIDEKYEHNIALNDRGKGVIEPQIMRQWFVDMSKLKEEAMNAVDQNLITFIPPRWKKHFLTWMNTVRDWNINRQIWLGHRIPVWWKTGVHGTDKEDGNFIVSLEKPVGDFTQDPDVLDTWFSSALWPFATLGWPRKSAERSGDKRDDLDIYYPTSVLVTGRDILYLWVARMIFSGLELMKGEEFGRAQRDDHHAKRGGRSVEERIPFTEVFIHPTVLTKEGKRMSKSLGTGIDPLTLIDEYGADATRFGLMSQMSYDSQAIKFDEGDVKAGRNFANKLWNIARLIKSLPLSEGEKEGVDTEPVEGVEVSIADQWIEQRFSSVRDLYYRALDEYKVGEAARLVYGFIWNDFADWYLEIVKHEGSGQVARRVFIESLKLLHPLMPFVSEVLWQKMGQTGLLITSPLAAPMKISSDASSAMIKFQDVVTTIRSMRTLLEIPVKAKINIWVEQPILPLAAAALTRADVVAEVVPGMHQLPLTSGGTVGIASAHITAESIATAQKQLDTTIAELRKFLERLSATLVRMKDKAPPAVVTEKERQKDLILQQLAQAERSRAALG